MLGRCDIDPISSIGVYCIELYKIIFSSHDHECMITENCLRVVPGSEGKLNSETQGCSPIFPILQFKSKNKSLDPTWLRCRTLMGCMPRQAAAMWWSCMVPCGGHAAVTATTYKSTWICPFVQHLRVRFSCLSPSLAL
jgi:hypothetical protein